MMKDYDAYLFDWDGTLGRTLEVWLDVMHSQFKRYGIQGLTDTEVVKSFGRLTHVEQDFGIPANKLAAFMDDVQKEATLRSASVGLYEGALPVLERLKNADKKIALITTNWRESIDVMLENNHLLDIFDMVISGDDVKRHKPDPEGINEALISLSVNKDDAVMIGDSPHDLDAAANAEIDSILFYPPSHQLFYDIGVLRKHNPTYIIDGWNKWDIKAGR